MGLLRPTFMGFQTALRSIEVNQKAVDIVANNLSNVDTPGYTRQRVDVASIAPQAYSARIASSRIGIMGQGVEALGVGQIRDSFLDKRFRDEYTKAAYHGQAAQLLTDVQAALGDGGDITDESVLFGALARIFVSLQDYVIEPTLDSQANLVLSAMRNFTQVLQHLDSKLTAVASSQVYDVGLQVDRVNEIFNEIAHYNFLISQDSTVMADPTNEYFRPNELLDKRNLLLDELSSYGDIHIVTLANGMVNVDFAGLPAVVEKKAEVIRLHVNDDQTIGIIWNPTGQELRLSGGTLKANVDFLNGRGRNIQNSYETTHEGIPYYRDRLNTLAQAFANTVNSIVPERAFPHEPGNNEYLLDANGNVVYKTLIGAMQEDASVLPGGQVPITAANITISREWAEEGPGYFIFSKHENTTAFAHQMATALTGDKVQFVSRGETFTGTFEDYILDYVTNLGSQIQFHDGRFESIAMVADDFLDRRDAISGVNRDEETANMLIFQKSYNAAARMMTTLDDMIDLIINRMGRVGL